MGLAPQEQRKVGMSKKNHRKSESINESEKQETSTTNGHMEIVIEKGISIPAPVRSKTKYPFNKLNPGESFVIHRNTGGASVTVAYWKKKLPERSFTVRALSEEDLSKLKDAGDIPQEVTKATRVWRTDGIEVA